MWNFETLQDAVEIRDLVERLADAHARLADAYDDNDNLTARLEAAENQVGRRPIWLPSFNIFPRINKCGD